MKSADFFLKEREGSDEILTINWSGERKGQIRAVPMFREVRRGIQTSVAPAS